MSVLDASAVVALLLGGDAAEATAARIGDGALHAPHLLDIEVTHVLRRLDAAGRIDAARARMSLALLADWPLQRHRHDALLPRIWALRANLTAYDAAYVALAEALDRPLITRDRRLAGAAGHQARIVLIDPEARRTDDPGR